jgi:hypothetical protein
VTADLPRAYLQNLYPGPEVDTASGCPQAGGNQPQAYCPLDLNRFLRLRERTFEETPWDFIDGVKKENLWKEYRAALRPIPLPFQRFPARTPG